MGDNGGGVGDRLRSLLERIERLREEVAALKADEREIFMEAKSAGFDPRTMREVLKWRAMAEAEREEREALFDVYRAALGELGDTPLGAAALRRIQRPPASGKRRDPEADGADLGGDDAAGFTAADRPQTSSPSAEEMLAATAAGAAAAKAGKPVLDNPYTDARRAAWDEGWCATQGSDGMDIPAAFRRSKPRAGARPPTGADAGGADA